MTCTPTRPSADDVSENVTVRRAAAWLIVVEAVAAGCPIPVGVYVARNGSGVTVTVNDLYDLAAWIVHLQAPAATAREYRREPGEQWQRTHRVAHVVGTVLVDVNHDERITAPTGGVA